MLMAICIRGMTPRETAELTRAMCDSGKCYRWDDVPGPKVDKHSTGGVGDKTSLIIAPLAASCGVIVPMMAGRGLGHTGGTLDKLESIPGFRIQLHENEFRKALLKVGAVIVGQTSELAPADRKLYALRDVTGTVESIPLLTSSILSKKLAEGIDGLVMDVKWGAGGFMKTIDGGQALADAIAAVGNANGVKTEVVLTDMNVPLGRYVGNSLEVIESIQTLRGEGPKDVETLSVSLAARMVRLGGLAASDAEAEAKVRAALRSGAGLEKFRQIIEQQGGDARVLDDMNRLPLAPKRLLFRAERSGTIVDMNAEKIGLGATVLGAGRNRAEDSVDHAVGVMIAARVNEKIQSGDAILEIHYRDEGKLAQALPLFKEAISYG
jgi:pyrimidine-nucleoside phosphorylase